MKKMLALLAAIVLVMLPLPSLGTDLTAPEDAALPPLADNQDEPLSAPIDEAALSLQMLEKLNNTLYETAYQYLLEGKVLKSGVKGNAAKGLQQLIVLLGEETAANGTLSSKTIASLNKVQQAFGLTTGKEVKLEDFRGLMACALYMLDADSAGELLYDAYPQDQLEYWEASACMQQERYYSAQMIFEFLSYLDSEKRAEQCVQSWPKNGQLYRNKSYKATQCSLKIHAAMEQGEATYLKIYSLNEDLVSTVFIAGSGSATVKLPKGTYYIKIGTGSTWYGPAESFGDSYDAQYGKLTFDDNSEGNITLKSGYQYELTLGGVEDGNVGAEGEEWGSF